VLYRLRRIEEIGGLQLDDPATRLNLHLCLRIREVLPTTTAAAR
jgi:DNA-binding PucR family transcriptional regulator